ncbi:glycosyl hydrolase family 28 protein [Providencia sp. PROV270]|uniref:tail fiber/spike domain-containing protein n=1 Tax=Providencia sp. PROV270 TaxID=2949958 RepID=UPI00234AC351|nr:glycosyl hydrolase family 28 protein [Providencia sp. PROV270]
MREVKPTQKPVPSNDIKDLFFNSGLLDIWATSLERKYIDRFGNCHLTAAGMEWLFKELVEKFKVDMNAAIVAAGYITIDSFQQGADLPNNELTQRNQILRDETTGEYYRWDGDLPKQVPAGSTPQSTGGIGKGAWFIIIGNGYVRIPAAHLLYIDYGIYPTPGIDNSAKITEFANTLDLTLSRDVTFESDQIVPLGRLVLDGSGATIKNLSKTKPLFFDNAIKVSNDTFKLTNINLDLNKNNVISGNLAGGGVWLGSENAIGSTLKWKTVIIENVDCINSFRVCLNLISINNVFVRNYSLTEGGVAGSGFFSYGGSTENCRKVIMEDIVVKDTYGFGWHLYRCDNVDACNVEFKNLYKDGYAIGFTLTESKKVHIRNHVAQTDGDALEINACQDVIIENFDVNGGNRGLLIGDNGTGIDNQRITLRNGVVTGGSNYSAAINYCHNLLVEGVTFNGPISVIASQVNRSSNLKFRNCEIGQNINNSLVGIQFIHESTRFLDCVYSQNNNTFEMMDTGGLTLAKDEYIVIPVNPVLNNRAAVFYVELCGGYVAAGASQMGWRRYKCVYAGVSDESLNNILVTLEDEAVGYGAARNLTLEIINGEMRATNKGQLAILGNFSLRGVRCTERKIRP